MYIYMSSSISSSSTTAPPTFRSWFAKTLKRVKKVLRPPSLPSPSLPPLDMHATIVQLINDKTLNPDFKMPPRKRRFVTIKAKRRIFEPAPPSTPLPVKEEEEEKHEGIAIGLDSFLPSSAE